MSLDCTICGKQFNTNAGLYDHKERMHKPPSVVLVNHSEHMPKTTNMHGSDSENGSMVTVDGVSDDSQENSDLEVVDEIKDEHVDGQRKRQVSRTDSQEDSDLEVADTWVRPRRKRRVSDGSRQDIGDMPGPDEKLGVSSDSDEFQSADSEIKDSNNKMKRLKKRLKKEQICREKLRKCKMRYKNALARINSERLKFDEDINDLRSRFRKQIQDKDMECEDRVHRLKEDYKARLVEMESDHKDKIKTLEGYIQDLRDDDADFSKLSEAIFNCTTIEEIGRIQGLINDHKIDEVIRNHLPTLQKLLLSLSYGIIPICDSQRRAITNSQRELVKSIQGSSKAKAKNIIKRERAGIINLFSIINDSLKLVRDSFNRYDIRNS